MFSASAPQWQRGQGSKGLYPSTAVYTALGTRTVHSGSRYGMQGVYITRIRAEWTVRCIDRQIQCQAFLPLGCWICWAALCGTDRTLTAVVITTHSIWDSETQQPKRKENDYWFNMEFTEARKVDSYVQMERIWFVVRFEVFTAVTMKNGVFWVVTSCGSCKNRRFGGTWRLHHLG
jgi:hypothetical protein